MSTQLNITDPETIETVIGLTGASLITEIAEIPGIKGVPGAYELVVGAGQIAYAESYKYVYLVSVSLSPLRIACRAMLLFGRLGC